MTSTKRNPAIDGFLRREKKWREEIAALRDIILESEVAEELKWGKPCYTYEGRNVVIIIPLKESCALSFAKGVLLKDPAGLLTKPGESTQAGRWIKFTSAAQIEKQRRLLRDYVREAVEAEKAGLKVEFKKNPEPMPAELEARLDRTAALKKAFSALTPGRQRGYILFISGAKQAQTREARVEKCVPLILSGKGLND